MQPWVFLPSDRVPLFEKKLSLLNSGATDATMPNPRLTHLEEVVPWKYRSWDRKLEALADEA